MNFMAEALDILDVFFLYFVLAVKRLMPKNYMEPQNGGLVQMIFLFDLVDF